MNLLDRLLAPIGAARDGLERETRRVLLGAVDTVAASRVAADVVDRVLASALVERATRHALAGSLPALIVQDVVEYRLVERAAEELACAEIFDQAELDRLATQLVHSPAAELVIARVMESGLIDEVLEGLLERESFWRVVDEVAASHSVTAAISHQSRGFADEVAGEVRGRSVRADEWLEQRARRIARRRPARNGG